MAENKKSFILYCDLIHTVRKMPKRKQADLFMTILGYVNDENPTVDDLLVSVAFEPIKHQLKRDLKRWEKYIEKQSENGKLGGRPKKPKESQKTQAFFQKPKKAVTVNVTVTDTVNDNVKKNLYIKPDENYILDLPDVKINSAIQYLTLTKNVKANREIVLSLWTVFKEKHFTGENSYKSKAKIFTHFFDSLKYENLNGTSKHTSENKTGLGGKSGGFGILNQALGKTE